MPGALRGAGVDPERSRGGGLRERGSEQVIVLYTQTQINIHYHTQTVVANGGRM